MRGRGKPRKSATAHQRPGCQRAAFGMIARRELTQVTAGTELAEEWPRKHDDASGGSVAVS
jgi:hypothetical protein